MGRLLRRHGARKPTRRQLLQSALERVGTNGDPAIPWSEIPELADEFENEADLLATLHRRWYARFAARLDELLENPPPDLATAVRNLWQELTDEEPAWRGLLDAYRAHPTVAAAEERQRRLLVQATAGEVTTLPETGPRAPRATA